MPLKLNVSRLICDLGGPAAVSRKIEGPRQSAYRWARNDFINSLALARLVELLRSQKKGPVDAYFEETVEKKKISTRKGKANNDGDRSPAP